MGILEEDEAALGLGCSVPSDQKGSFMGRVSSFPLSVSIDREFKEDERQQILYTIAAWNAASQQAIAQDLFRAQVIDIPESARSLNPKDCSQDFGDESSFAIIRERSDSHWKKSLALSDSIPGATFRCERSGKVIKQMIYIYPEKIDAKQVSSVLIHELGHSIGLDHSCLQSDPHFPQDRPDYRSCDGLSTNHPYRQAIMFPFLHVPLKGTRDVPEVKDSLRANDLLRGHCAMGLKS